MKDLELEKILRRWAQELVSRYTWLTIRFEYSEKREVYLVTYAPVWEMDREERFFLESSAFEDRMRETYGDDAPLFCYDERYFKLSPHAEVIRHSKPEVVRGNQPEPAPVRHLPRKPKRPRPVEVEEPIEV